MPYSVFANGPLSACICPPPERSPSCRLQPPTSVQSAIATPTSAACYGPPPNPQASPDLQETARCMPASSYSQTRTLPPIWESSVSAGTLGLSLGYFATPTGLRPTYTLSQLSVIWPTNYVFITTSFWSEMWRCNAFWSKKRHSHLHHDGLVQFCNTALKNSLFGQEPLICIRSLCY